MEKVWNHQELAARGRRALVNRSTDDAISITLHTALSHLDKSNNYVRMLFIDYS
jgi:hypothetical protein